jgi:drug/metabolite transporter (DMT)-like permease
MALNFFFTYTAKNIAPNAGYVTAVKGAQVIPLMMLGVFVFKEKVSIRQWIGALIMLSGLLLLLNA